MQRRVAAPDIADIALEVLHVDCVEADDGLPRSAPRYRDRRGSHTHRVQANVCFRDPIAVVVRAGRFGHLGFGSVERSEQRCDAALVRILSGGKSALVNA